MVGLSLPASVSVLFSDIFEAHLMKDIGVITTDKSVALDQGTPKCVVAGKKIYLLNYTDNLCIFN